MSSARVANSVRINTISASLAAVSTPHAISLNPLSVLLSSSTAPSNRTVVGLRLLLLLLLPPPPPPPLSTRNR
jgi:hypothetical protein